MSNILHEHQINFLLSLSYLSDEELKSILEDSSHAYSLLDDDDYDTLWDIE